MAGEIKKYNGLYSGAQIDDALKDVIENKGKAGGLTSLDETGKVPSEQIAAPSYATDTLLASNWTGNSYSFEAVYPHARYNISIEVAPTATPEQFEAFGAAMICGSADSNVATALGDVPSVDIPIIIKVVRK